MKKTLQGFIKFTQIDHSLCFITVSTLLGVTSAAGSFDWRLFILLAANWLSVSVGYMIENITTAPDDALSTYKSAHNPISTGLLTPRQARIATLIVTIISIILYSLLGIWPLLFGVAVLLVGFLSASQGYSSKVTAVFELLSNSLMMAGLPYMAGYFAFVKQLNQSWFWLLVFILSVSLYGKIDQLTADKQGHPINQRSHKKGPLNRRATHILMLTMLFIAMITGAGALLINSLIPMWVAIGILVLAIIFSLPRVIKIIYTKGNRSIQGVFRKSLESAAALGLFLQFFIPWLSQLFSIPLIWWLK